MEAEERGEGKWWQMFYKVQVSYAFQKQQRFASRNAGAGWVELASGGRVMMGGGELKPERQSINDTFKGLKCTEEKGERAPRERGNVF